MSFFKKPEVHTPEQVGQSDDELVYGDLSEDFSDQEDAVVAE